MSDNKYLTPDDFDEVDREALTRARSIVLAKGGDTARNLLQTEIEDGFFIAASGCSYSLQYEALNLRPWEDPPAHIDANKLDELIARGDPSSGVRLLKRMLSAGISQWEPDPVGAINAKGKQR